MAKTKLIAFANFQDFKKNQKEEGTYVLVLPYGVVNKRREALWAHYCSNVEYAMIDLKYTNRSKFLNEYFGEGNWEIEFYEFKTVEESEKYCKEIAVECDLDKLDKQFEDYKANDLQI